MLKSYRLFKMNCIYLFISHKKCLETPRYTCVDSENQAVLLKNTIITQNVSWIIVVAGRVVGQSVYLITIVKTYKISCKYFAEIVLF